MSSISDITGSLSELDPLTAPATDPAKADDDQISKASPPALDPTADEFQPQGLETGFSGRDATSKQRSGSVDDPVTEEKGSITSESIDGEVPGSNHARPSKSTSEMTVQSWLSDQITSPSDCPDDRDVLIRKLLQQRQELEIQLAKKGSDLDKAKQSLDWRQRVLQGMNIMQQRSSSMLHKRQQDLEQRNLHIQKLSVTLMGLAQENATLGLQLSAERREAQTTQAALTETLNCYEAKLRANQEVYRRDIQALSAQVADAHDELSQRDSQSAFPPPGSFNAMSNIWKSP